MLGDKAYCHVHQQNCATISNSQDADLLIAGYPCNRSSQLNPCRFDQGEGDGAVGNEHSDVLLDLAALIHKIRPKMFILENVTGILKRRAGASESADQNVLQWVHEQLDRHLKGAFKFMDFVVDSKPLHLACSAQARVHHRRLQGRGRVLVAWQAGDVKERPVHHAFAFFNSNESSDGADPMEVDPVKEANYATCFKTAYEKAVLAKRVDKGAQVPDVRRRFCALNAAEPFVKSASPWLKSQLDVFLEVSECMAMMGAAGYDFHGLTSTQSSELIGKAMCSTALVKVLLPVLRHLGQFEST
ncbi:unnamed protein product [Symbiodinium necroappetens]|uniref:DNA (cytosine-5-)-methyltransferase n=1 Tax=Symbiodinium necroappetens TaxID=1628268 RepID=A0A812TZV2_9DINO|nr:unnamed protein product [Symbiodinium necroappetens]